MPNKVPHRAGAGALRSILTFWREGSSGSQGVGLGLRSLQRGPGCHSGPSDLTLHRGPPTHTQSKARIYKFHAFPPSALRTYREGRRGSQTSDACCHISQSPVGQWVQSPGHCPLVSAARNLCLEGVAPSRLSVLLCCSVLFLR